MSNRAQRRQATQQVAAQSRGPLPGASEVVDLGQLGKEPQIIDFTEIDPRPEFPSNAQAFIRSLNINGSWLPAKGIVVPGPDGRPQVQPIMERSQYLDAEQLIEEVSRKTIQGLVDVLLNYAAMASGTVSEEQFKARYADPEPTPDPDDEFDPNEPEILHVGKPVVRGLAEEPDGFMGPEDLTESDRLAIGLGPA